MTNRKEDCFHLGVKALILNEEKDILLLERHHPFKGRYWDIPGGRLQKGESQLDTLRREVKEETGFDKMGSVYPLMMALTDIRIPACEGDVGLIFSIFLMNIKESFQPILSSEHTHFEWCPVLEASERLKLQYPSVFIERLYSL